MMHNILAVSNVSKKFCRSLRLGMLYTAMDVCRDTLGIGNSTDRLRTGEFWSLANVSFALEPGACLGIVGANGAGKSTLLKLLNGIIRPDTGSIRINGRVGALIEIGAGFHPMLTGRENIYVNGSILNMGKREIDRKLDAIIDFSGLEPGIIDEPVKTYSSGMYVRLGFAVAVHAEPDILLIDEVLAVGDMGFQAKCLNTLGSIRNNGTTIVLVSHNLNHVAGWANRALALDRGRLISLGEPHTVIQRYSDLLVGRAELDSTGRSANGSGRLLVKDVRVVDSDGRRVQMVTAGKPIAIIIELQSNASICDLELDLKIYDEHSNLISAASSRYTGDRLAVTEGRCSIRADYPPVPLNGGYIRPSVALWAANRSELLDWVEEKPLPVKGIAAAQSYLWWRPRYIVERLSADQVASIGDGELTTGAVGG